MSKLSIKFVYDLVDEALWRMSVYYTMNALNAIGYPAACCNIAYQPPGKADVFIFYRCVSRAALQAMNELRRDGFVVYAIDDYLFQPDCLRRWKIEPSDYLRFFDAADAVMVDNSRLLDHVPSKNKFLYRTTIDRESFDLLGGGTRRDDAPFTIGWLSGNAHGMDEFVIRMLTIVDECLELNEKCVFHQFGEHSVGKYARVNVVNNSYVSVEKWRDLYRQWASLGLDLSVNPLDEKDEFCHCKSELKFVEAGAMGVPLLASRMAQFTEVIKDGENGFFASTPEEFADKILTLMRNRQLVRKAGAAARDFVEKECLAYVRTQQLLERLRQAMEKSKA